MEISLSFSLLNCTLLLTLGVNCQNFQKTIWANSIRIRYKYNKTNNKCTSSVTVLLINAGVIN